MSEKFYCKRKGGWKVRDSGGAVVEQLLEGTAEKGPWYLTWQFSDHRIEEWLKMGIIEMVD